MVADVREFSPLFQEEPGTFQRASEEVLKSRRIVKARRAGEAATQTSEQSGASNPFAKITLTIPGQPGASGRIESVAAGPTSVEVIPSPPCMQNCG